MARPRSFDEDKVLEGAVSLFHEKGYDGTSVPELSRRLGICRQSLYQAFGDKRGLYLKALQRWGEREVEPRMRLLSGEGSPLENVRTVIRGFAAKATSCPDTGCLTVTAMVENRDDADVLAIVEQQVERMERGFADALRSAKEQGELSEGSHPDRLAPAMVTTCYGMGLLSRLPSSGPRIADAVSMLLGLLDAAAK